MNSELLPAKAETIHLIVMRGAVRRLSQLTLGIFLTFLSPGGDYNPRLRHMQVNIQSSNYYK